jgi:hypothetical protein
VCSSLSSAQVMAKRHANPSYRSTFTNPSSPRGAVRGENCQRPTGQMAKGSLAREEPETLLLAAPSEIVAARNRSSKGLALPAPFSFQLAPLPGGSEETLLMKSRVKLVDSLRAQELVSEDVPRPAASRWP